MWGEQSNRWWQELKFALKNLNNKDIFIVDRYGYIVKYRFIPQLKKYYKDKRFEPIYISTPECRNTKLYELRIDAL